MKFSFIVPMYDSATYLAKTLDSIVAMVGQKKKLLKFYCLMMVPLMILLK